MTDSELISLFESDPHSAAAELVGLYNNLVYKIVYSKLGGICRYEDIEETVSDIFALMIRSVRNGNIDVRKGTLKGYISVTAKRCSIRRAKQIFNAEKHISLEDAEPYLSEEEQMPQEERKMIADCILNLGKPDSDIITMKYFYGMKSAEIGKRLDIKTNTVDKRIGRALAKLKKMLEE